MLFKLINLENKTHWPSIRSSVIQEHLAKKIKKLEKKAKRGMYVSCQNPPIRSGDPLKSKVHKIETDHSGR